MIKCSRCKRLTKEGESTGKFIVIKNKQIISSEIVCMNCNGELLLK